MLILTRRINETLMIEFEGELVEVTVLGIKGNQVRIGCKASRDIAIHREEIYQRIKREEKQDGDREYDGNIASDYDDRGADYFE